MVQLGSKRSLHASWQMIDSSIMREVDSFDDGCIRHRYLTRNSDVVKVGMAQTWLYNGTSRKNSNLMIQWLADKSTARAEGTATWWFNSLQMSRRLKLKEQQLVDAMACAKDNDDNDNKVAERLRWSWGLGR